MPDEFVINETADSDTSEAKSQPRAHWHYWRVLGELIFVQTVLGLIFFNPNAPRHNENFFIAILGLLFSHPLLLALWAALAPHRFYVRFLWCLPLCVGMSFLMELKNVMTNRGSDMDFFIIVICLSIFLVATAILMLVRHFTHWQIKHLSAVEWESDYRPYQFGIKHIIILTTITGFVMGLFKSLIVISSHATMPSVGEVTRILSEILLMIVPILFVYWFSLVDFHRRTDSGFAAVVFLILAEIAVYIFVPMIEGPGTNMYNIIPFFQLGCGLSVLITALVMRKCGFRLVREA